MPDRTLSLVLSLSHHESPSTNTQATAAAVSIGQTVQMASPRVSPERSVRAAPLGVRPVPLRTLLALVVIVGAISDPSIPTAWMERSWSCWS